MSIKTGAIIHCRVSSAKQAIEGESLEVQSDICERIVAERGWTLAHQPWLESFSGRKDRRPTFEEILDFLDEHPGVAKFYIFRSIDRFTRGGSFSYEQMKRELARRGVEMIDSHGIIQPPKNTLEHTGFTYPWSVRSPSEITEVVLATTASQEITTILTRLIGQEIRLTQEGYKVRRATDGFVNQRIYVEGKKKVIEVPNPERAHFYIEMFNMRASGRYSDQEIVDRVNATGYRSRVFLRWDRAHRNIVGQRGGAPLGVKALQKILRRTIYAGVKVEKWTHGKPVRAKYDGLVSIATFNQANRGKVFIKELDNGTLQLLYDYNPERSVQHKTRVNPLYPYKNVVLCPYCSNPFLGSASRSKSGKHVPAYHCSRGHKRIGINKKLFDENVERMIKSLRFSTEVLSHFEAILVNRYRERQAEIVQRASHTSANVADLEAQKAAAIKSYISATAESLRQGIEAHIADLDKQIELGRSFRNTLEITESDLSSFLARARFVMEHPSELLLNAENPSQQRAMYSLVFDGLPTYHEIINGTPKLTWIFRVFSQSETAESLSVRLRDLGWNTIEQTVLRWKELFQMGGLCLS